MEVESSIYEYIDKRYAGNENMLQLEKPATLVVLNIYKAYDNVNLDIIDPYIPDEVREEWMNAKRHLQINKNINGGSIKPTKGISQGSELATVILNFLTTIILKDPLFKKEIEPYWKFAIYTDNWTIWTTELRKNTAYRLIKFKAILNKYGLTFRDNEVKIYESQYLSEIEPINIEHKENKFTTKLGEGLNQPGRALTLDPNDKIIEINKYKNTCLNNVTNTAFKHDTLKFLYESFKVWSQKTANWYWYENKLYKWNKQMVINYKNPKELIQNMNDENTKIKKYGKYAGNYNYRFKYDNIKIQYYLNRWKSLAKWTSTQKFNLRRRNYNTNWEVKQAQNLN